MKINLPRDVKYIISRLQDAGYEAYAVGGCVRDTILCREPDDWDITTSAQPYEIKSLFNPTIDTGIQHGTVTVLRNHVGYEVTTYRIDGEYEDSRHPKEVLFTSNLKEDLLRRDFTINAMAYNDTDGLVDEYNGIGDIKASIIRCVGDARERFSEDALRMMRAIRFSAQLGYSIDEGTKKAIKELYPNLKKISAERICTELTKLLVSNHPDYLRVAYELGITSIILPEFDECMRCEQNNPHHCYNVGEHLLHSMLAVENDKVLRFATLFHDFGKPVCISVDEEGVNHFKGHSDESAKMAHDIMKRLKFDNDTLGKVEKLVKYHDVKIELSKKAVRKMMNKIGVELFPYLLLVKEADILAQSQFMRKEKEDEIALLWKYYDEIVEKAECVTIKDLAISGKDLIEIGMKPGPQLGDVLNKILEIVLDDPYKNSKECLLQIARELI